MTPGPALRWIMFLFIGAVAVGNAQQEIGVPVPPLGNGPFLFDTAEQGKIRVTVVTKGLSHPWSIAFLPDGAMLIAERPGRLRVVRKGVLDPTPIAGVPRVRTDGNGGLMDVALHPRFAENRLLYLTYTKPVENGKGTPSLARGRLDGGALNDVRDLVVPDAYEGNGGLNGRVAFGRDGMVYFSTGGNIGKVAQDPASLRGKILRLRDDGSVPPDNPFVGRAGYRPEIYTLGHRNTLALIVHPDTGVLWNNENGPNGGDEINIILPGRNYGWPIVSFGREYPGPRISEHPTREGMESPLVAWLPQIAAAGMAVYTGDRFPAWKGNVFVGSMRTGGIAGTGHLERIVFNAKTEELRRESMLNELRQRIREVRQGPDGLLYLLTDEDDGALLRIEPASELTAQDRAEIQELVTKYARALSSCASHEYASLFVPDGVFVSDDFRGTRHRAMYGPNGGKLVGRVQLAELVETEDFCLDRSTTRAARPVTLPNVLIVPTADGATGTIALANDGRYEDEYIKTPEGWRFKTRKVVMPRQQETQPPPVTPR